MAQKSPKQADYYAWTTDSVILRGDEVQRSVKPGMASIERADPASMLLADHVQVEEGQSVLVLNCGAGLVGIIAGRESRGGQIWLADANVVATEAARRTLATNDVNGVEFFTSSGTKHLPEQRTFDVVTVRLPKGKQLALQLLLDGYHALKPGGRLYFAGANDEGIKTHLKNLDRLFGSSVMLGFKKGCRVAMATKAEEATALPKPFNEPWLAHDSVEQFTSDKVDQAAERPLTICTQAGVFSAAKLDQGTAILLDQMAIEPGDRVLDLGCGSGILGAVAAAQSGSGHAVLVDADVNAVEAARRTLSANELTNAEVVLSDGITQLKLDEGSLFDVVVANPPFHQGKGTHYDVGIQFIVDAASVLKDGGKLFLVANQFLKYESEVDRHLGQCKTIFKDGRFKVLRGIKNPRPA